MHLIKLLSVLAALSFATGCLEDLNPDSEDLRSEADLAAKLSDNFTAITSMNNSIDLDDELLSNDAVVLYFTMWCPLCDSHMSHIQRHVINNYTNVQFYMVDYISGSVSQSRSSQVANGFASLALLADNNQVLLDQYQATMASVIVINDQKEILLNEDYKNGARLIDVLDNLLEGQ
jgi:peroxiredoxin